LDIEEALDSAKDAGSYQAYMAGTARALNIRRDLEAARQAEADAAGPADVSDIDDAELVDMLIGAVRMVPESVLIELQSAIDSRLGGPVLELVADAGE